MIVASTVWAIASNTFPAYDSLDLINAAKELGTDDMPMWNGWYMERYPYQMPFVMVIRLLLGMVGDSQLYIALEFLNAICAGATALLLVRLSRQLFSDKAAVMTGLFSFFFLPLFLYSTFAYGNVPSLPFALAAILWQSKFMETNTWRHVIFAAMAITVSILLKSTMIVVLMAMCLILLIHAMVKRNWHSIAGIIVPIVVYAACSHGFFTVMEKKYDVVVFGMPTNFHYGNGMGTNPIQMMQALSAQVIRHKRILSDRCVFIVSSICDGYFHDERWPYLRKLYEMFQHDYMQTLPDMNRYGEYFATNEEYIRKYRFANAFHPFHGFSMMSCGHIAEMNTSAIYIVGAREPGIARGMGIKTRATFEEALEDAKKKIVGPNPNILALPRAFTTTAVHLCMKDPSQNSHTRDGITHLCGGC